MPAAADTYPPSFSSIWVSGPSSGKANEEVVYTVEATDPEYLEGEVVTITVDGDVFTDDFNAEGVAKVHVTLPSPAGLYTLTLETLSLSVDKSVTVGKAVTVTKLKIKFKDKKKVIVSGKAPSDTKLAISTTKPNGNVNEGSAKAKGGEFSYTFKSKAKGTYTTMVSVIPTKKYFGSSASWVKSATK